MNLNPTFLILLALFAVELAIGFWILKKTKKENRLSQSWRENVTSFFFSYLNYNFGLLAILSFYPIMVKAEAYQPIQLSTLAWWYWPALFIAHEFVFYWHHRFSHSFALPWLFHGVHHTSTKMNLLAGARAIKGGILTLLWVFTVPLVLMGFRIPHVFLIYSITMTYQVVMHTELVGRLGWLDQFLMTPEVHRVHHGANRPYYNKNFGGMTCVFDRLFGTHQLIDPKVPITYGVVNYSADQGNPLSVVWNLWKPYLKQSWRPATWFKRLPL